MRSTIVFGALLFASTGCFSGADPSAQRVRSDDSSSWLPQGEVHFVEHGQRSEGVFVSATKGGENAFRVGWTAVLAPLPPTSLEGPAWTGRKPSQADAIAYFDLPYYRHGFNLNLAGEVAQAEFDQAAVWIVGTNPFIVAFPSGTPRQSWNVSPAGAAGVSPSPRPFGRFGVRFVVNSDLSQSISGLAVFPADFLVDEWHSQVRDSTPSIFKLEPPLTIGDALDVIANGDLAKLGPATTMPAWPAGRANAKSTSTGR